MFIQEWLFSRKTVGVADMVAEQVLHHGQTGRLMDGSLAVLEEILLCHRKHREEIIIEIQVLLLQTFNIDTKLILEYTLIQIVIINKHNSFGDS